MNLRVSLLTLLTLVAFAANSILCRLALSGGSIDAASFTLVRIASGAAFLALLTLVSRRRAAWGSGSWLSGALLFGYGAAFSFAYLNLGAGTGGLILFATVQFTMIGVGIAKGERPSKLEWLGLVIAQGGLIVLVAPGLHAPQPLSAVLMAVAGVSWGIYSLRGRTATDPTLATSDNFLRATPFALALAAIALSHAHIAAYGVGLGVVSGALTSGLGYVVWYTVLPNLTATRAAITQLTVPALVAFGGVLLLSEKVHPRFLIASAMMLGGVATAVLTRQSRPTR